MARGTLFSDLRQRLRAETGRSSEVNVGTDDVPMLNEVINRVYETFYQKHDWPFLRQRFDLPLFAGERYYDFPTGLDSDRVETVSNLFQNFYTPINRGIGDAEYSIYDSEADIRLDPVMRWDIRYVEDAGREQIEVWPVPTTNDQAIRFTGIRAISRLVNDADPCLIDDNLILLYAKLEMLPKGADKEVVSQAAANHFLMLKASKTAQRYTMNGVIDSGRPSKAVVVVRG